MVRWTYWIFWWFCWGPSVLPKLRGTFRQKKDVGWLVAYTENWGKEYWWVCGWFWSSPSWSKWQGLRFNILRSCFFGVGKRGAPMVPGKILFWNIYLLLKKERAWEAHQKRINYQSSKPIFIQLQKKQKFYITWWCLFPSLISFEFNWVHFSHALNHGFTIAFAGRKASVRLT